MVKVGVVAMVGVLVGVSVRVAVAVNEGVHKLSITMLATIVGDAKYEAYALLSHGPHPYPLPLLVDST